MNGTAPALGIDLGGTKIEAALLAPDGSTAWRQRVATPAGDYAATLQAVAALFATARTHAGRDITVGVGAPGAATPEGPMKNCNSTCLNGRPLQYDLQTLLGQPVALANDANCLALSEATDGAGAGADVVFAAILGTGVGAGIAVHGRVLPGVNGIAGEWGHNPLPWADAGDPRWPCYCGHSGCIETLVSGPGLARDHAARHAACLDAREIALRAAAGDAACADTLDRHAHRLARALAAVVNVIDPDVVVLGGGVSRIDSLYTGLPGLLPRWIFAAGTTDTRLRTRIVPALHGDASGVRGAAWLGRTAAQAVLR